MARAFYPSEDAAAGTGLWWVFSLVLILGVAVAAQLFQEKLRFRITWTDVFVISLVALVGASVRMGVEQRAAITIGWEWAGLGIVYLLARNLTRTREETSAFVGIWMATAVAVAVYGLFQVAVELPALQAQFRADPEGMLRRMGVEPGTPGAVSLRARLLDSKEPFSTFALANSLAGFLVGPLVVAVGLAIENLRSGGRSKAASRVLAYPLALIPALALLVCLLLTKSRSAWLGLAAGSIFILIRAWARVSRKSLLIALGAGLVAVGSLVSVGLATRQLDREVLTEAAKSLKYRFEWWEATWDLLNNRDVPFEPKLAAGPALPGEVVRQDSQVRPEAEAFWKGLGPANFAGPYLRHKLPQSSEEILDPHNFILEVWTTAGLPAMVVVLLAVGFGVVTSARSEGDETAEADDGSENRKSGAVTWILAGGIGGWALVALTGRLDPFRGDLLGRWLILGVSWLLAIGLGAPLWNRRAIPAAVLGAAVLAMAINLLAAGGIGVPSVAIGLWLPLAFGLSLRENQGSGRIREKPGIWPGVVLAFGWAALIGAFYGSVGPFWRSEAALARGDAYATARTPAFELARQQYLDAGGFDRFSPQPWISLAGLEYRFWSSPEGQNHPDHWRNVFITLDKAVQPPLRNADSLPVRRLQAALAREILTRLPKPTPLDLLFVRTQIARAVRHQARLYPTSAEIRSQLAFASADLGMFDDALQEADIALTLDRITPHLDKKLSPRARQQLQSSITTWTEAKQAASEVKGKDPAQTQSK